MRPNGRTPLRSFSLGIVVALIGMGCGGSSLPMQPTYKVTGQVLLDGKPVAGATIVFHPIDATNFKWNERPQAKTDDQGRFTLTTYKVDDGAPAGEYRVAIASLDAGADDGSDQQKHTRGALRLPRNYWSHETSGLTAKVDQQATILAPFELKGRR